MGVDSIPPWLQRARMAQHSLPPHEGGAAGGMAGAGNSSLLLTDRRQVILASLGDDASAHVKMGIDLHTHRRAWDSPKSHPQPRHLPSPSGQYLAPT